MSTPSTPSPLLQHYYLSTACLHGMHDKCGAGMRSRGETGPPHCKFCPAVCTCNAPSCWHRGAATLVSPGGDP